MMLVHVTHTTISPMQLFPATYDRPRTRNTFRYTVHAQRHRTVAVAQYLERHVEMRSPAPELNFAPNGLVGFAASARSGAKAPPLAPTANPTKPLSARIVQVPGPQYIYEFACITPVFLSCNHVPRSYIIIYH